MTVHKFEIICLTETYLDYSIPFDDNSLEISGYSLICSDQPYISKYEGVCIYDKNFLPLRVCDISLLGECINFELKIGDKLCRFVALYRCLSQAQDEFFVVFTEKLSENNLHLLVAIGDFNPFSTNVRLM